MKTPCLPVLGLLFSACISCSVLEQSSRHGFETGVYSVQHSSGQYKNAWVTVGSDTIGVHEKTGATYQMQPGLVVNLANNSTPCGNSFRFKKQGLDVDITSVLFKYRPGQKGNPPELTTDFNAALYTGWRWDYYTLKTRKNALQQCTPHLSARGFDAGIFAGAGSTPVNAFTTAGEYPNEYNGMVVQYGIAAFMETTFVSFGIGLGFDTLLTPEKKYWIYQNRPWIGFIVGIAIN